jgi:hypothetical protein
MKRFLNSLLALLLAVYPASAAVVQITVKDAAGTSRSFNVTTNTDITGNLDGNMVICDQAAGTTCASVGTAGSPSTNALTVQAVTLGHGTAANAIRVELPTDGTGVLASIGTVTTITNITNNNTPDGLDVAQGAKADAVCGTDTGTCSLIALVKRTNQVVDSAIPAGANNIGFVSLASATTGGCTPGSKLLATASVNSNSIKGVAGTLCSLTVIQTTTTLGDLRIYDSAAAPTCSSSTGVVANIPIQSNATSPGVVVNIGTFGHNFSNGIGYCFTGAVADNDATNWGGTNLGVAINYATK